MPGTMEAIIRCISSLAVAFQVEAQSKWYASKAWGKTDQADFINLVVRGLTSLTPKELMRFLLELEMELGRDRADAEHWGPRLIDLDILYWEHKTSVHADVLLPHPQLRNRSFALIPLLEIGPHLTKEEYFRKVSAEKLQSFRKELNEISL